MTQFALRTTSQNDMSHRFYDTCQKSNSESKQLYRYIYIYIFQYVYVEGL